MEKQLRKSGWDKTAIAGYQSYLDNKIITATEHEIKTIKKTLEEESFLIGSPLYEYMFDVSMLSSKEKITLVLKQLNAEIDAYGFLQLSGKFKLDKRIPPHASFFSKFRKAVQEAFPTKEGLNSSELGRKVHLFRSYIDKQNIDYIRSNFNGNSDFEKLQAYGENYQLIFDYSTGANYHNRTIGAFDFPRNMKVQVPKNNTSQKPYNNARMAEFIVDLKTGNFVSEWNVYLHHSKRRYVSNPKNYDFNQCGDIANTESFNYGPSHGKNKDIPWYDKTHHYLDVKHPKDPDLRSQITKKWKSEKDFDKGGNYADIVKVGEIDYERWQHIPDAKRQIVYQEFLADCKRRKKNNGFHHYWQRTQKSINSRKQLLRYGLIFLFVCFTIFVGVIIYLNING